MMPQLWLVAGPNGSGKTTLSRRFLIDRLPVIDPDRIARQIDSANSLSPVVAMQAGREALRLQRQYVAGGRSFAVETTFSGHREPALMREARGAGYKVNLLFVCTDAPEISIGRIIERTGAGEHHVSATDVIRRYQRSLDNLAGGLVLADRAWLLDNSGERLRLVASLERCQVKGISQDLPQWVRKAQLPALTLDDGTSL